MKEKDRNRYRSLSVPFQCYFSSCLLRLERGVFICGIATLRHQYLAGEVRAGHVCSGTIPGLYRDGQFLQWQKAFSRTVRTAQRRNHSWACEIISRITKTITAILSQNGNSALKNKGLGFKFTVESHILHLKRQQDNFK